jgi:ketosteroid isomerase-like protein
MPDNPEPAMNASIHPRRSALCIAGLLLVASPLALAAATAAVPAQKPALVAKPETVPKPALMSAAECVVWERERSFAQTVEAHDPVAFAEHIREDAVFEAGTLAPTRGRAAILDSWKDTIAGKGQLLRWYPDIVTIGGNPDIALSHGVFWLQDDSPGAKQRFRTGSFNTIWQKGADGVWKVLFDWGGAPPVAVTAEEFARLKAALPAMCPRG